MKRLWPGFLMRVLVLVAVAGYAMHAWGSESAADAGSPQVAEDTRASRLVIETVRGPAVFQVELAVTPQELTQGLQDRRSLPADAGMLFDFGAERIVTMWMKNTYIPLDMLFIRAEGTVAAIAEYTEPLSLETIASPVPVRAVLEVNAGTAARLGIRAGDRVRHPMFSP